MNDYLEQVEAQLAELTERGAHQHFRARHAGGPSRGADRPRRGAGWSDRGAGWSGRGVEWSGRGPGRSSYGAGGPGPPRRRSEALAFVAAFAVAAAVVAIVVLNVGRSPRHASPTAAPSRTTTTTTTTHPSTTVPGKPTGAISLPIPANFHPQSFTAISELTWWLLGPAPCTFAGESPPCGAILRTTDGGRHFLAIGAPHATLSSAGAGTSGYSQLRFADAKNAFAYGPSLFTTHDGGVSWNPVNAGGTVVDLAISGGEAYAVVEPVGGGNGHLIHSPVDQDDWTTVSAAGTVSGGLWVQGSDVIVQSGVGTGIGGSVLVSHDAGSSFATSPAPSPGLPCHFAEPAPPVVWAHCATGMESGVWRSSDGGANFTAVVATGLRLPNSAAFAAASASTAVVGYQQLYRTTDDGVTWSPVGPPGIAQWAYLGFTDPTHGVALGYVGSVAPGNERLYYTTDGGQSYHLVPLP